MSNSLIKEEAERRGIPYLVHFTRVSNLRSILEYGLYPRVRHHELASTPAVNDTERLDRRPDATSVSISFPNSKLFYKFRYGDYPGIDWAVLRLQPSVLWEEHCLFCRYNAADTRISSRTDEELRSPTAFASMFDDSEKPGERVAQRLKLFDPTDVQAEVLIKDVIEPSRIMSISFETLEVRRHWETLIPAEHSIRCLIDRDSFSQRQIARGIYRS